MDYSQVGYPNYVNLVVAMPLTGRPLPYQIMFAYHALTPPMNTNMLQFHTEGWPVDRARNHLVKCALEAKAPFIFFWDEDVQVPPFTLRELMYKMEHHPEAGVIGGVYCLKTEKPEPLVFRGNGKGAFWDWRAGEFFEVSGIGMGCTLIRTELFKDLEEPWFLTVSNSDEHLEGIPRTVGWTEDLYFCHKLLQKKKWKIYADSVILAPHLDVKTGKAYTLPVDSKPMRHLMVEAGKKKIVDIGCGSSKYKTEEGTVIGVDIREEVNPDYRADFRRLPFGTNEFDIVYSSHTLEHCPRNEVSDCLDEWTRILKQDGEMRLVLPNIEWAAEKIKKGVVDTDVLNVLYGAQGHEMNFHKCGFTPAMVREELTKRKFGKIDIHLDGYNIIVQAWRQNGKPEKKRKKNAVA